MIDLSNKFCPVPKNPRIEDKKLLKDKQGNCKYCKKERVATEKHHIKSKGSGGDDTEENTIELCRICHALAHAGKITKAQLKKVKSKITTRAR